MDENMEELNNIITLNDENGNEVKFEFLDLIEYESEDYIRLRVPKGLKEKYRKEAEKEI